MKKSSLRAQTVKRTFYEDFISHQKLLIADKGTVPTLFV